MVTSLAETHKDVANNINTKVLMTYMADAPTKIIPPTQFGQ